MIIFRKEVGEGRRETVKRCCPKKKKNLENLKYERFSKIQWKIWKVKLKSQRVEGT